jgi:hypothetical protein
MTNPKKSWRPRSIPHGDSTVNYYLLNLVRWGSSSDGVLGPGRIKVNHRDDALDDER